MPSLTLLYRYLRGTAHRRRLAITGLLTLPSLVVALLYPHLWLVLVAGLAGLAGAGALVWVRPPRPRVPGWYALVGLFAITAPLLFIFTATQASQLATLWARGTTVAAVVTDPVENTHVNKGVTSHDFCFTPRRASDGAPVAAPICDGHPRYAGDRVDVVYDPWGLAPPALRTEVRHAGAWFVAAVLLLGATVGMGRIAGTPDPESGAVAAQRNTDAMREQLLGQVAERARAAERDQPDG